MSDIANAIGFVACRTLDTVAMPSCLTSGDQFAYGFMIMGWILLSALAALLWPAGSS